MRFAMPECHHILCFRLHRPIHPRLIEVNSMKPKSKPYLPKHSKLLLLALGMSSGFQTRLMIVRRRRRTDVLRGVLIAGFGLEDLRGSCVAL